MGVHEQPRVLMITSFFYPFLGGAEQQVLQLSRVLRQKGIPVSVLTRKFTGQASFEIINGIPVHRCIRVLPFARLFGLTYLFSVLLFLFRNRKQYTIIHCHILQNFHSIAALLIKRFFKKKVIVKVAMAGAISDFAMLKQVLFGKYYLKALRAIDRLIVLCTQSEEEAIGEGFPRSSIMRIPNGVDISHFRPPQPGNSRTHTKLLFIGTLDCRKGVHLLIDALKKLHEHGLKVYLDIVGDGPERQNLQQRAQLLGLSEHITFLGAVHEVAGCLQNADIFVLPSLSEGLPNALLEAMACGLPVVAARVGGVSDIIQDRINGLLVDPDNVHALSTAISVLLHDMVLAKELGAHARDTIVKHFSLEAVAAKYCSLYEELLKV